jgi:hypothetical protein
MFAVLGEEWNFGRIDHRDRVTPEIFIRWLIDRISSGDHAIYLNKLALPWDVKNAYFIDLRKAIHALESLMEKRFVSTQKISRGIMVIDIFQAD